MTRQTQPCRAIHVQFRLILNNPKMVIEAVCKVMPYEDTTNKQENTCVIKMSFNYLVENHLYRTYRHQNLPFDL